MFILSLDRSDHRPLAAKQGKFVRIFFNGAGAISGANIDWYLLEKSRVTSRSVDERSFHVFFQLLRGADPDLLRELVGWLQRPGRTLGWSVR